MQYLPEIVCTVLVIVCAAILIANRSGKTGDREKISHHRLEQKLRHAGLPPRTSLWFFRAVCVLLPILLGLLASNLTAQKEYIFVSAAVGAVLPTYLLRRWIKRRQDRIRRGLSLFVDLLTSLSKAGMSLEKTFAVAAREGFHPAHPIAIEVDLLRRELQLGRERDEAFQMLAERTGVTELGALASSIRMGIRSGAPVEESLASQAEFLRFQQQEDAARHLSKLAATTMIPVFLSGIPLWAIVVYFPIVLEILDTIRTLNPF